jgi:long-chain acyl-CoA synthetase
MAKEDTLPKLLIRNYQRYGKKAVAMREKDRGIWKRYTWEDYYKSVKYLSLCLVSLGLERGDKVAILGETKPQAYWAELAILSAGGVAVGIFADCTPPEVRFYVSHSDSRFIIAHDQEQVDKILQIKDELPLLKKVIYWDEKGLWFYDAPILMSLSDALEMGKEYERSHPGLFEENINRGNGDDIALILYTSGTTGIPKGAMLNHRGLIRAGDAIREVDSLDDKDVYLSFIPMAWVGEQIIGVACSIYSGMVVNFPEKAETVQENIREIGASILFYGPRQWESVNRMVQAKIRDASWIKRFFYNLFLPVGQKIANMHLAKQKPNLLWKTLHFLGYWTVFRPLRDKLGLSKVRVAYTAGSAISPDIIRLFQAIGVNAKQLYGSSEMGLVTAHREGDIKPESCGPPLPGAEVKLSDEGEILVKNEGMYVDYYNAHEAYLEKMDDGWYVTGDFGHIDEDGHLIVIDRMEDLRELSNGRKFSPQYTEVRLRFSPFIKDAIVVGGKDNDYVGVLVNIDMDNVGRWAESERISYTTFADLSQKKEVIGLVAEEVKKVNKTIPEWTRIRKFINLHKEFDPDEAELTRSRKLRRTFLEERYGDLVEALYGGKNEYEVETTVTYQDGRKGSLRCTLKVTSL